MSFFCNNKNTTQFFFFLVFLFGGSGVELYGQTITGMVTDKETGEELIFASISIFENGQLVAKGNTDFDGNYNIELKKGIYDVEVSYIGYPSENIEGIILSENQTLKINFQLEAKVFLSEPIPIGYKIPVLKKEKIEVARIENIETINRKLKLDINKPQTYIGDRSVKIVIVYRNMIDQLPTRSIPEIASYTAGVSICQ